MNKEDQLLRKYISQVTKSETEYFKLSEKQKALFKNSYGFACFKVNESVRECVDLIKNHFGKKIKDIQFPDLSSFK
tara:strand:+ start:1508 stop:1735 length:228 start_codon:yes stop_codon:yes gene_type:complete